MPVFLKTCGDRQRLHMPASETELAAGHLPRGIAIRNAFSIALACLLTFSFFTSAEARDGRRRKVRLPEHSMTAAYAAQTASVMTNCFSPRLAKHIGAYCSQHRAPLVTSGHRPRAHRAGSLHRLCQAADIRVPGVSESRILTAARTAPGIGGVGRYCNGIVHVDTAPRRQWVHCGRGKGGLLALKRRSARRA